MDDATLRSLGLNGSDKAKEIIRYREICKKYQSKIDKFERQFPNMRTEKAQMPDIFHYGKLTAYKEIIHYLKDIENHTLLEKLQSEDKDYST